MILLSFYSSKSRHLSEYKLKLFNLAGFLAHVQQFFCLLDKFEVWVSCEATFLINFSVWFFKIEFNPLPDLLNTGFEIMEIGLFYGGEHLGVKICRFLIFLTRSLPDLQDMAKELNLFFPELTFVFVECYTVIFCSL